MRHLPLQRGQLAILHQPKHIQLAQHREHYTHVTAITPAKVLIVIFSYSNMILYSF